MISTEEIKKMTTKERKDKLHELRLELVKTISSSKNRSKTKEIKKAIARILTLAKADKNSGKNTK